MLTVVLDAAGVEYTPARKTSITLPPLPLLPAQFKSFAASEQLIKFWSVVTAPPELVTGVTTEHSDWLVLPMRDPEKFTGPLYMLCPLSINIPRPAAAEFIDDPLEPPLNSVPSASRVHCAPLPRLLNWKPMPLAPGVPFPIFPPVI